MWACLATIAALTMSGPVGTPMPDSKARYESLLQEARRGDPATNWYALRQAYFARPEAAQSELALSATRVAMLKARQADAWQDLLRLSRQIIAVNYADGEAHLMAFVALSALGQKEEGEREHALTLAIFRSMLTHDGMSAANAIEVFNVHEEYELMHARMRKITLQTLKQQDGHSYDVLETIGRDGTPLTFWFQIDELVKNEQRALNKPST